MGRVRVQVQGSDTEESTLSGEVGCCRLTEELVNRAKSRLYYGVSLKLLRYKKRIIILNTSCGSYTI